MNKMLGPTFASELAEAGLSAVPFSWNEEYALTFNPGVSDADKAAVQAVIDSHDPTKQLVPQTVTRYQARVALANAGLLDQVNTYFVALPNSDLGKMAWQEAPTVERDSAALIAAGNALGLTDAQIDQLFIAAAAVQ
ncbi:hypothetical protein [Bordetella genomosp. 11]|uniref:Uncharacterized protein n=1 Tax=Bordetella genomosp. 11 TaxID=1416808 RepID=A0A261UIT8_9BORD|nr:hypothetical protein [Bordetella genomosp. 11]OZI61545.1 hypothetical protein CAL28_19880 [Bordetella genomosp. 11]